MMENIIKEIMSINTDTETLHCSNFFDAIDEMIFIKDPQLRYIFVNKALCDFFQKTKDEIYGKKDEELMSKEFAHNCYLGDKEALETNKMSISYESIENKTYETKKFPITLSSGIGIGGIITDISFQTSTNQKLLQEKEDLKS